MLSNAPLDIIYNIFPLLDDISNRNMIETCKNLNSIGNQTGYRTRIVLDIKTPYYIFRKRYEIHCRSITCMKFSQYNDVDLWIPKFVKNMRFFACIPPNHLINPNSGGSSCITETFEYIDYSRTRNKKILRVDWKKMKKLKYITLFCYDADLFGIENLPNLKNITINLLENNGKLNYYREKLKCNININTGLILGEYF